jgi:hypothetical protein
MGHRVGAENLFVLLMGNGNEIKVLLSHESLLEFNDVCGPRLCELVEFLAFMTASSYFAGNG